MKNNDAHIIENKDIISPTLKASRLRYIDQFRGYVVLYLIITAVWPANEWRERSFSVILHYIFSHPPHFSTYMTYYDVGALAFLFLLGMLVNSAYQNRFNKFGKRSANLHVLSRYGGIFLIGVMLLIFENELYSSETGILIIGMNFFISIAISGFITLIIARLVKSLYLRMIIGYSLILIYQILLVTTFFKWYAEYSIHGGIFGTFFGWTSCCIIASAVGDYIISSNHSDLMKLRNFSLFLLFNLIIGIVISFIPGWEASKHQVSLSYVLIAIGVTCSHILLFGIFDRILDWEIRYLQAFGKNPLFMYFLMGFPVFLLRETVGFDFCIPIWGNFISLAIILSFTSLIALFLYKKEKKISSTFIAIMIGGLGAISIIIWYFFAR